MGRFWRNIQDVTCEEPIKSASARSVDVFRVDHQEVEESEEVQEDQHQQNEEDNSQQPIEPTTDTTTEDQQDERNTNNNNQTMDNDYELSEQEADVLRMSTRGSERPLTNMTAHSVVVV